MDIVQAAARPEQTPAAPQLESPKTYSIRMTDCLGVTNVKEFECLGNELEECIQEKCEMFGAIDATIAKGQSKVDVTYTVYDGPFVADASYLCHVANYVLRRINEQSGDKHARILERVAADYVYLRAVALTSGSLTVEIDPDLYDSANYDEVLKP